MSGLIANVAARLADPARCPSLLQVATGVDARKAVETLALGEAVTALVTPIEDRTRNHTGTGLIVTRIEDHTFGVMMVLTFPAGFEQFDPAKAEIQAALQGWSPPAASEPIEYAGGSTLQYSVGQDGGRWLHMLRFRVTTQTTYEAQS